MREVGLVVVVLLCVAPGCYVSHQREVPGTDAGPRDAGPRDARPAPPDVPRTWSRCRVDATPRPGFGDPAPRPDDRDSSVLTEGSVGAQLRLVDLVITPDAASGDYTMLASGSTITARFGASTVGTATFDPGALAHGGAVAYPSTTYFFPGLGSFGIVAVSPGPPIPLSELPGLFDGVRVLHVDPPAVLRDGIDDTHHHIAAITVSPSAVPGDYTFVATRAGYSDPSSVVVSRDGFEVATTSYFWGETLDADHTHTFAFDGLFDVEIALSLRGSANLYGLEDAFFDGRDVLRVVCE